MWVRDILPSPLPFCLLRNSSQTPNVRLPTGGGSFSLMFTLKHLPRELAANLLPLQSLPAQQGTARPDALLQQALLHLPPLCAELNGYLVMLSLAKAHW